MVSRKNSPYDCDQLIVDITTTNFTRAKKRWRMVYATLYAVRVMLSLPKEAVYKRSNYSEISEQHDSFGGFPSFKGSQRDRGDLNSGLESVKKVSSPEEIQAAPTHDESHSYITSLDVKPSTCHDETGHYSSGPNNIDHARLAKMAKEKDLAALEEFGGVTGVTTSLGTNPENGIPSNDFEVNKRRELFGSNTYPKPPSNGFYYFVLDALKDMTILILCVCAALVLGFGIKEHGVKKGWYEGGSIFVAVLIVIVVTALGNFRQEIQFDKLSNISSNIKDVEVFRDRQRQQVSIFDIVVGDVVFLNIGDQIPADGLCLDGYSFQVDESSMTGESDYVEVDSTRNPFLLSGAKVADGYGRMLVTSVGMNTAWGEMMSSISQESNVRTPLQARLDKLTSSIGKVGLAVACLVLLVLLIRYFTGNTRDKKGDDEKYSDMLEKKMITAFASMITIAVTTVVVAIPEGLPLAVTLTVAYSIKRMIKDQATVRKLSACEKMGSATVICTDKTGALTLNQMKVTKFWVGQDSTAEDNSSITPNVRELFYQGVGLNTTPEISGSSTEKAILHWAVLYLGMDTERLKPSYDILQVETCNLHKKRSGVLIKRKVDNSIHVHWKGAAEMIVAMCSSYYDSNGTIKPLEEDARCRIEKIVQGMAASSLRCIAFAHRRIPEEEIDHKTLRKLKEDELILVGIVGLKDPCRPGVTNALRDCESAGVDIKMITGDNIFTAKAIATECGILKTEHDGQVVEGAEFRNYTDAERRDKVDNIRVMASCSPLDKLLMVQCLKNKGHVVAVIGDGPALKEADVALCMGIQGTEEASDIVILDDDFSSVAAVLRWGRYVYNNIQRFIQFQLTVNVAALVVNFIAAVSTGEVPLTSVQLLWVNLIMDTFGALALATVQPTDDELMQREPVPRTAPLVTNIMWRNLLAQALYQIFVLSTLLFWGKSIFNVTAGVNDTLIFNTFVLCQVFNEFNSRSMEKKNVFQGIHRNRLFIGIVGITILLQVALVEFLNKFADTDKLNVLQWVACIAFAALSWPVACVVKCIPVLEEPFFIVTNRSILRFQKHFVEVLGWILDGGCGPDLLPA